MFRCEMKRFEMTAIAQKSSIWIFQVTVTTTTTTNLKAYKSCLTDFLYLLDLKFKFKLETFYL